MATDNHNENNTSNLKADRQYLIDSGTNRLIMTLLLVGGISLMALLLFLAAYGKTGRYTDPDRTQYEATLNNAAAMLEGGTVAPDNEARVTLPIDTAIRAVADKGLSAVTTSLKQVGAPVPVVIEKVVVEQEVAVIEPVVIQTPVVTEVIPVQTEVVENVVITETVETTTETIQAPTAPVVVETSTVEAVQAPIVPVVVETTIVETVQTPITPVVVEATTVETVQVPTTPVVVETSMVETVQVPTTPTPVAIETVQALTAPVVVETSTVEAVQDPITPVVVEATIVEAVQVPATPIAVETTTIETVVTETRPVETVVETQTVNTMNTISTTNTVNMGTTGSTTSNSVVLGVAAGGAVASTVVLASGLQVQVNKDVYGACITCHQANGEGIITVFPPLAKHAVKLFNEDRDYLANIVLYGIEGTINVEGLSYNQPMRGYPELSDSDIAGVLNYILTTWGNESLLTDDFRPYVSKDIAGLRGQTLSPELMQTMRTTLDLN